MITNSVNFKIYFFLEILIGLSIAATIFLSIYSHDSIQFDIREVMSMSSNWIKQTYLEIIPSSLFDMCPSGYTPLMEEIWPGTVDTCNCKVTTNSLVPVHYANQINRMTCTSEMLKAGCENVPQISQKELF